MAGAGAGGIDPGSKAIVHKFFGEDRGNIMALEAGYGKSYDYRGVLEPTDAVTQCERAGVTMPSNCYLCGQAIPSQAELQERGGTKHELYPECEHILPVTEARWYLMLYMSTMPPTTEWEDTSIRLEYALAHRVCNQAKSNFSFVKDDGQGNPVVNDAGFITILSKIRRRALDDLESAPPRGVTYTASDIKTLRDIANTILNRKQAILKKNINPIIQHANRAPELQNLTTLARVAGVVDPNALSSRVKKAYDNWDGLTDEQRGAQVQALLESFYTRMYEAYPGFKKEAIIEILRTNPVLQATSSEAHWTEDDFNDSANQVDTLLKLYFNRIANAKTEREQSRRAAGWVEKGGIEKEYEPAGESLPHVVFYGVYLHLFNRLRERRTGKQSPTTTNAFCTLYEMLAAYRTIPEVKTTLDTVFGGKELELTNVEARLCSARSDKIQRDIRRDIRRLQREKAVDVPVVEAEEDEEEDEDMVGSVEDALTYYFTGLTDTLVANGIDPGFAATVETWARNEYKTIAQTNPDSRSVLDEVANRATEILELYVLGETLSPEQAQLIDTTIRALGDEKFASEEEVAAMQEEPAGAGAGPTAGGGKRPTHRRPLYG